MPVEAIHLEVDVLNDLGIAQSAAGDHVAAMAAQRAGKVGKASALYGEAVQGARDMETREFEASALLGLAEQYQEAKRHEDALQLLDAVRLIEGDIGPSQQARLEILTAESRHALDPESDATGDAIRRAVAAVETIRSDLARSQLTSDLGRGFREIAGRPYIPLADHLLRRAAGSGEGLQDELRAARDAIEGFKTWELNDFYRDDCVSLALENAKNLDQIGDPKVAVVYYIPLDDRTELLVGHDTGLRRFTSPIGGEELFAIARRFRYHLESDYGTYRYFTEAEALHQYLIKPLLGHLQGLGIKHLVFVPDGSLGNIPLGALFVGQLNRELTGDFPPYHARFGIYTGPIYAAALGSEKQFDFSFMGTTTNKASRLESLDRNDFRPEECPVRVLISDQTKQALDDTEAVVPFGEGLTKLKGFEEEPEQVWEVKIDCKNGEGSR